MNCLSQKLCYASVMIDLVINVFSLNEVIIKLRICDHSIITLKKKDCVYNFQTLIMMTVYTGS